MKTNKNCNWQELGTKHSVIILIRTIFHPCLDVPTIKYVADIPSSFLNIKQARKAVQRYPICIYDEDYDYILETTGYVCNIFNSWHI